MWTIRKKIKITLIIIIVGLIVFFVRMIYIHITAISSSLNKGIHRTTNETKPEISPYKILGKGDGIVFLETTDRLEPPSLVICSIESAARVYPDRPVAYFMRGLGNISTKEKERQTRKRFPTLLPYENIYFFPLVMEELFKYTPLSPWYQKINPLFQIYWKHVLSDACRFATMWKYGGIYMDTDVISMRRIPQTRFVVAQSPGVTSSSVFGLPPFHSWTWEFMENFVTDYKGWEWAHQGPGVFTRVLKKLCGEKVMYSAENTKCKDIAYFHSQCFYPIPYELWETFFQVHKKPQDFNDSYGLHLWNFKNSKGLKMVPGSDTLVELLYKNHCPLTYRAIQRKERLYFE